LVHPIFPLVQVYILIEVINTVCMFLSTPNVLRQFWTTQKGAVAP
jgi:hypothetical protein